MIAQYLPLYHLSAGDLATIVRTFLDVFPEATMWFCGIDTVLIGSKGPLNVDLDRMAERMADPAVLPALLDMGVAKPGDVLGWYVAGPQQLREMGGDAQRNVADFPILEFSAPKAIALPGVAATMPAVLTAFDALSSHDLRNQLNDLATRPLDSQALYDAANARRAGRWLARGQLVYSYNYVDRYLEAVSQARALRPGDRFIQRSLADAQYSVGEQQMNDGYPRDAFSYYYDSYLNDGTSAAAVVRAVEAALDVGDSSLADQTLKLASPEHEDVFGVLVCKGLVSLRFADYDLARTALEQAAALDQESPTMHVCLGYLDLRDGRRDSANVHFERALRVSTNPVETAYDIVDRCAGGGFTSDARPYAERLVALASGAIAADPGRDYLYGYRSLAYSTLGEDQLAARDLATKRSLSGWWQGESLLDPVENVTSP
jgi:Flp pilus assembly protein TadD